MRPLIAGSMGEALHLTHSERIEIIQAARAALDEAGLTQTPIIAGTGTGSTRETVELTKEAAAAGADYAIVIASGYFAGALTKKALKAFWAEVSEKSPIPILIYNCKLRDPLYTCCYLKLLVIDPGASGGIDLDSDLITELAIEYPNLAGVKLTSVLLRYSLTRRVLTRSDRCGNVGKLTRICATVSDASFSSLYPRKNPDAPFLVLGGYADFLLPSAYANGHGAITGLANVAPVGTFRNVCQPFRLTQHIQYTIVRLFELSEGVRTNPSLLPEAQRLQGIVGRADFTIAKASISGTKALIEKLYGYGGLPRKPLPPIEPDAFEALWAHPHVQDIVKVERELSGKASS